METELQKAPDVSGGSRWEVRSHLNGRSPRRKNEHFKEEKILFTVLLDIQYRLAICQKYTADTFPYTSSPNHISG
jgi:hypothetical protein